MKALPNLSRLHWALVISVLLHAILLSIRFVDPKAFDRVFQDTPLEVILVNANTKDRPTEVNDKATAIAQTQLLGGGDAASGRSTSPLPPSAITDLGDAADDEQKKIEEMLQKQTLMLAQIKQEIANLSQPDPQIKGTPEALAREERRKQLIKILAEIEKRINEENARPKRRFISPNTREEVYALYYDGLRRKIEDKGTENFPTAAGQKLYGELTMVVTVNHDGRVLATEVAQSSGNAILDKRAQAIARNAGPFGKFSQAMRRKADQIVVVSRFKFTKDEVLETKQLNR
jgi:periplasmic protein TonB